MTSDIQARLERRIGVVHARQRLGMEQESAPRVFGKGLNFFHPENWYSSHSLLRSFLKLAGVYWRGRRNALQFSVQQNRLQLNHLPPAFEGFSILHLSDLHTDMYPLACEKLAEIIPGLEYDLCVLTGDYRAGTFGDIERSMAGMRTVCAALKRPVYAVLGNHDSIRMVPELEDMGVNVLLNESTLLEREGGAIFLAGIDDAHYYRVDNIEKAASSIPGEAVSLLLSHTPEIYRQAAHAGFDALLCGHTHGGQICLPGGYPITIDSNCPRYMAAGSWRYRDMQGYTTRGAGTSIVEVRYNCPPEITLHRLSRTQ